MSKFAHGLMPESEVHTGLKLLKKRQRNFLYLFLASSSVLIVTLLAGFLQQDLVAGYFGLTAEVEQLHIPVTAQQLALMGQEQDYFISLLSWFGWLILKVCVAFIGAFFIVHLLKKIRFFYVRFQSFILKFVAWLIGFIVLWSGLTYVQYDVNDHEEQAYSMLTQYSQHIGDSVIYQQLQASQTPASVQAYLLAQTALLHQPVDRAAAEPYVAHLVQAERDDPQFKHYGFKAEQLWTMQQQLYAKSVTPSTQALASQVEKMQVAHQQFAYALKILGGVCMVLSLLFWLLSQYFARRGQYIQQRIEN
ncbi:hypothetical protein [Acinetobacter sp. B51(2017)]|uniref:hypothetical protein n=1 Tax=Acinetobacter sp. B51(2017) TaxID=2060938 RepID=UPI0020771B17|nr:hypothetical protein [Acinetobacter sp. B51(2017)]